MKGSYNEELTLSCDEEKTLLCETLCNDAV